MSAPAANLRINPDRLWDSLMEMAKIGPGVAGGNNRQTLTDEDGEGRHLFQQVVRTGGAHHGCRHHGQHVHDAARHRSGCASRLCRLSPRHPAHRWQV
jgi:hypothetical protein